MTIDERIAPPLDHLSISDRMPRYQRVLGKHGLFWIIGISVTVVVLLFVWLLFQPSGTTASTLLPTGSRAPTFTLTDTTGHPIQLTQYRGHPVLINFWATYCAPCRTETPLLQRTLIAHQSDGLVILGVDAAEPQDAITSFGTEYHLSYPLLADFTLAINQRYGVVSLPATYFIDAQGIIRSTVNGILLNPTLAAGLQTIGVKPTPGS